MTSLAVELYLHSRESANGQWFLSFIVSKRINKAYFIRERQPLVAERFELTPQEELFAKFFNEQVELVKDMDVVQLRAMREELSRIAFEARAKLTATDDVIRKHEKKPREHRTALKADELTTNAINAIKNRGQRQTKEEKALQGLLKMGMSQKDAEAMLSAGNILSRLKKHDETVKPAEATAKFVNPFAVQADIDKAVAEEKQAEEKAREERKAKASEVTINEETNTVIVTKEEIPEQAPKAGFSFVNPFAK